MNGSMQFIKHQEGGDPKTLALGHTAMPTLSLGQVLLKVTCFGVNRADTLQRQGKYPAPEGESSILGLEVSGEIVQFNAKQRVNPRFKLGDKVFGLVAGGGYAQYVAVNIEHIMLVPPNMSMVQAAGVAECFLTAYQALFVESNLQSRQQVLIHAGASGVGLAAIQLAKRHNCQVAVTASSQKKLDFCQSLGANLLVNYQQQDFATEIAQQWPGCDLIIDFVAGDYLNRNLKLLNTDGSVLYLVMLAGRYADGLDMALMLSKRATVKASTLRNRSDVYKTQLIDGFSRSCLADFAKHQLTAVIDSEYAAKDIGQAHQRIESNDTMGKLIGCW